MYIYFTLKEDINYSYEDNIYSNFEVEYNLFIILNIIITEKIFNLIISFTCFDFKRFLNIVLAYWFSSTKEFLYFVVISVMIVTQFLFTSGKGLFKLSWTKKVILIWEHCFYLFSACLKYSSLRFLRYSLLKTVRLGILNLFWPIFTVVLHKCNSLLLSTFYIYISFCIQVEFY